MKGDCRYRDKDDSERCHTCKRFGHSGQNCWQNSQDNSYKKPYHIKGNDTNISSKDEEKSIKCKTCKKLGHLEKECNCGNQQNVKNKINNGNIISSTPTTSDVQNLIPPKNQDVLMLFMKSLLDQWHQQNQE